MRRNFILVASISVHHCVPIDEIKCIYPFDREESKNKSTIELKYSNTILHSVETVEAIHLRIEICQK